MRNYSYFCRPPTENAERVHEQFRLAHAYHCALIAIERRRRGVVDQLYQRACPSEWAAYGAASAAARDAVAKMRQTRARPGDMLEPDEEMKGEMREAADQARAALTAAREAERLVREAWLVAKKAATPRLRARLKMCDRGAYARVKRAYNLGSDVGLAWGTRLKIGESVERASKAAREHGALPHFPKFDGGGVIAVQLQGGLDPELALGGEDTRFRLQVVDTAIWAEVQRRSHLYSRPKKDGRVVELPRPNPDSKRSQRRKLRAETLARQSSVLARLRIGSDGRTPVWASWPIVLDRPLPEGAPIKWAQVVARKIGSRTEWQLLVTVADEQPIRRSDGTVLAVNYGWRNLDDGGVRVAYAVGSDGREEEVRVPPEFVSGMAKVESIRSIRDKLFDAARQYVVDWRDASEALDRDRLLGRLQVAGGTGLPAWLAEELRYADQWRSPARLATLLRVWRDRRFAGDESVFATLTKWRQKNAHLRFWECDQRQRLLRMRREHYRVVAAHWATEYALILESDTDFRDFAELPEPEEAADSKDRAQRRTRTLAAPSEMRGAVKNACSTRGAVNKKVKGAYKTQTCNTCGIVFAFAARQDLVHTCECGARWDQDANHDRNLLASGSVASGSGGPLAATVAGGASGGETEKRGRWQRRRSQSAVQEGASVARIGEL